MGVLSVERNSTVRCILPGPYPDILVRYARTLERVGQVGIFLLIKHSACYFAGRAAGIQLTADR
jgi:hypothetical protein